MRAPKRTFGIARNLRKKLSLPEAVLWRALRRDQLQGLRFRRQHPIGPFVLDFYCPSARLAIEVDGAVHDFAERLVRDERRDALLAERGIRTLRFAARDVLNDEGLEGVLLMIADVALTPSTADAREEARGGDGAS
ncbi:endonuclease domain-containing protein [Chenggangzhangella methanolivorans]|uniref:Endonuclease domain-containing protein n=2 Tax=Chenggangzhangella methanolivorans TaxID=1437009 RepID=A0A9E6RCN9_9HYPH|nr:endonuclease domain-containing protein [Chenggangzhangella methanolivorans]QZO00864.1 endonuclease domain-containing protein [Chenggangzhangella methanolivorans]